MNTRFWGWNWKKAEPPAPSAKRLAHRTVCSARSYLAEQARCQESQALREALAIVRRVCTDCAQAVEGETRGSSAKALFKMWDGAK